MGECHLVTLAVGGGRWLEMLDPSQFWYDSPGPLRIRLVGAGR